MLNRKICECTDSSFFLIDKNYCLSSFNVESIDQLGFMLEKKPTLGEKVGEIIAQKYRDSFFTLVERCFNGAGFSTLQKFKTAKSEELVMLVVFTPVPVNGNIDFVSCTIVDNSERISALKILRRYSHLTSHELRAPIANILGLSTIHNLSSAGTYDMLKINNLLSDINMQAIKLDGVIQVLNGMINQQESSGIFDPIYIEEKDNHIVLVDDDIITNKLHQMLIKKHNSNKKIALFDNPIIALEYVKEHKPDLILLDLHMPEIDGWKFLEMMEELNLFINVIIVSSSIDPMDRAKAKSFISVKDFYVKPLTFEKIKFLLEK